VLGAVVCNIMFWKLNKKNPEHLCSVTVVLGLSVWIIYILDRLLDNKKLNIHLTERHIFHQEYAKFLWYLIVILSLICFILVFSLPINIIIFGILIALITGIYLLIISTISSKNSFQYFKEPITALVYTAVVFGTTILNNPTVNSLIIGIIFLLIVFQNLLLFSLLEFKNNAYSYNLVVYIGIKKSNFFIGMIALINSILGLFLIYYSMIAYETSVILFEIAMSLLLLMINQFDYFFMINDRYRWVGDGIFLLPLVIIL